MIQALFARLRELEIRLWLENDTLKYSAPPGTLTDELRSELRARKPEIVRFLQEAELGDAVDAQPIPRRGDTGPLPLSFAQQRLWFLHQLDPETIAYHIPVAYWVRGALDQVVLENALVEIQRRHESLRTTFDSSGTSDPVQVVSPVASLKLRIEDLRGMESEERGQELARQVDEEIGRPFDLEKGPLLRATLLRTGDEEHVLVIVFHHIISDGWSLGVFHRELAAIFDAFLQNRPSPLPDLPIQYGDFAVWQREWLSGEALEKQLSYWRRHLHDLKHLDLPTDHPRPQYQTFRGATHHHVLSRVVSETLDTFAQETGTTPAMVIQAAFAAQLHKYSGQSDITVGIPIANRNRGEIEGLIGFFVNSLAVRTDLSGDPTFSELLERVRTSSLESFQHQDLPFEKLVEELQPERDPSRNPLFQVWCAYQNVPLGSMGLGNLRIEPYDLGIAPTRFDLELHTWEAGKDRLLVFFYNPDLFQAETVYRFAHHFENLLAGAMTVPDRPISDISLMTEAEIRTIVEELNKTDVPYPADATLHGLFEAQVARTPDAPAVRFGDQRITYRELDIRASELAVELRRRGVGAFGLVGVYMERSIEMVVALFATLKAGGAYLPIEPANPPRRVTSMLRDARPRVVLTQEGLVEALREAWPDGPGPADASILVVDGSDGPRIELGEEVAVEVSSEDLAYVIFTSGSTGRPKGVMVTHRAICNRLFWMQSEYDLSARDKVLQKTPFAFDVSVWEFFWPLMVGAELVMAVPEGHKDPQYLAETIRSAGITTMHFVPSMMQIFLAEARETQGLPLKRVFSSGEALTTELANRFLRRFPDSELHNLYGPTEAAVDVTYHRCRLDETRAMVPIGRPVANTQLYILDSKMQPVPIGVFGELFLGGMQVARGYLGQPELTAERFLKDPWSADPQARLYRTGDVVRYLPDGSVEFKGRSDFQVKIRGNRIECGEIEVSLTEDPRVDHAVVVAREDRPGDQSLTGYLVLSEGARDQVLSGSDDGTPSLIQEWEQVYDDTYGTPGQESTVSFVGWNSSFTGEPIPVPEMEEWVAGICGRAEESGPRSILELGCGNGLLLFEIAPRVDRYVGSDISNVAVEGVRAHAAQLGLEQVTALQLSADDHSGLEEDAFDLVLLNSVIQYFPSIEYLMEVLDQSLERTAPGGRILVGDVRSLPLLRTFYSAVAEARMDPSAGPAEKREAVRRIAMTDRELVVDPEFFRVWAEGHPRVTSVQLLPKRGRSENELTTYRYDVVIQADGKGGEASDIPWETWNPSWTMETLRRRLENDSPDRFGMTGIRNSRTASALDVEAKIFGEEPDDGVAGISGSVIGLHPEDLLELGDSLGYEVELRWNDAHSRLSALFIPKGSGSGAPVAFPSRPPVRRRWREYANDPLREELERRVIPDLRDGLAEKLPDYMVPSTFMVLDALPLTSSGKLDRKALPVPESRTRRLGTELVEPRDETEAALVEIWKGLLNLDRVGIEDNFFNLGGHSLMATQLVSRVREAFHVDVPLRTIFATPTVKGLAIEILDLQASALPDDELAQLLDLLEEGP